MILFSCPGCQAQLEAVEGQIGMQVKCGGCGEHLEVPPATCLALPGSVQPPKLIPVVRVSPRSVENIESRGPRRRGRGASECPECASPERPVRRNRISQNGWIVFALLLVFFFPLFFIGLLMTEDVFECPDCGFKSANRRDFDPEA